MNDEENIAQKYGYQDEDLTTEAGAFPEVVKTAKLILAVVVLVGVVAAGYRLWNYDPPKQWDVTEQAASWWKDFSNRDRKFPRKRTWDPDNLPVVDVPYEPVDIYDPTF